MKNSIYILLLAVLTLTSCKNEPSKEEVALQKQIEAYDLLMTEAMDVHDEIMPKMGELMELKGELVASKEGAELSEDQLMKLDATAGNLKASHDGMMDWMADYSEKFPYGEPSPETKADLDIKMPVLEQEVVEIKELRDHTMTAITNAKEILTN